MPRPYHGATLPGKLGRPCLVSIGRPCLVNIGRPCLVNTGRLCLVKYRPVSDTACVISGSRRAMQQYISELDPDRRERNTIKKTTFEEIKRGLELGGAYAFDETSYKRFYPLAKQAGLGVMEADFEQHKAVGDRFLIIQLQ